MYTTAIFIAIVTGIVEAIKRLLKLNKRYLPILSVLLGVGAAFLGQNGFDMNIRETILFGIMLGLTSCGLFSSLNSINYVAKQIGNKIARRTK